MDTLINKVGAADDVDVMKDSNSVSIGVASPETIKKWSHGEVKSPETINYRSFKPEKNGLFCERIFGPSKDYECSCGKYKRVKNKGITCDRCGVEVTQSRVRRERMGHIELAVPVSHIWFFKCLPSRLGMMLSMGQKALEAVLYYESYVVIDPGDTPLKEKEILTQAQYEENRSNYGDSFVAGMGAEAIETLLGKMDLPRIYEELQSELATTKSKQARKTIVKRIRLIEGFQQHKMDPRWMILHILPVIPPDLRPLVPLEGGRFATSDLNDLYRRVINRNSRLKNLLNIHTPEVIIRNEKRMLQEAVDALMDNGRHGRAVTGTGNRPLKSLTCMLKGKQGRFRQNLLGKRVDYSGRSVIVVGPEFNINQCGLPKEMALRLFEPFIMRRLREMDLVHTVRNAKKWIEARRKEVWDILDEVVSGHPIMLNRAPTLHRLSIQAFDPVLIDGQAIRLHPLVCSAFNADFDGDQMAVHVPLSNEAQMEAKLIMLAPNNIFSPASGKPMTIPSQDMVLGIYYLCYEDGHRKQRFAQKSPEEQPYFDDYNEVLRAMECHFMAQETNHNSRAPRECGLHVHDFINFKNPYYRSEEETARIKALPAAERELQEAEDRKMVWGLRKEKYIVTTPGRLIYHSIWPECLGFWNQNAGKKDIGKMIKQCYEACGNDALLTLLDRLKNLGYTWATRAGFSISTDDMLIPDDKGKRVKDAQKEVEEKHKQKLAGAITEGERASQCRDIWTKVRNDLKSELQTTLFKNRGRMEINPVWAMMDSGARGSADQVTQLGGMRGLMSDTSGRVLETPIIHNFREGLTGLEYFNSTHGARKGMADTALKTADAGYMTRRLVDVAHDVICTEEDCHCSNGLWVEAIREENKVILSLVDRIEGRFAVDDIYDKMGGLLIRGGEEITKHIARKIADAGIERVHIRSVLTCESERGICAKCYGRNLATGALPLEGDALGIIAAQSIGEPGTQLTLRTFHTGGTASGEASSREIHCKWDNLLPELQYKIDELESRAKAEKMSDKELEKAKKALLDKENKCYLEFEEFDTIEGWVDDKPAQIVVSREGRIRAFGVSYDKNGKSKISGTELATIEIPYGAVLKVNDEDIVAAGTVIAERDPFNKPVITREGGRVVYEDLVDGQTMRKVENLQTGRNDIMVIQHPEDIHPALKIVDPKDESVVLFSEILNEGTQILVEEGALVRQGDTLAKIPRAQASTNDITMGLPRVAELFEARRPREAAVIAKCDGTIEICKSSKNKQVVKIKDLETGICTEHLINAGKRLIVSNEDFVRMGDCLTDGAPVLQDYLEICGPQKMQTMLVNAVQGVYLKQGVDINDKHIEIIVRQMMRKIRITDPHDTTFLFGEVIDQRIFKATNEQIVAKGLVPAEGQQTLLGITKAALATDSFISAASFQDTPRVLTEAATLGRVDLLHGFKENVIMGHLIPAGTGYYKVQNPELKCYNQNGELCEIVDNGGTFSAEDNSDDNGDDENTFINPTAVSTVDEADVVENGITIDGSDHSSAADLLDSVD